MKTINKKTTIMTSFTITTLLIAGASLIGEQNAYAVSVPIDLPGFELPVLADGQFTPNHAAAPAEWTFTGTSGVFNPTVVHMASEANGGSNQGYTNTGSICQTLTTEIEGDKLYTLGVYVGNRSDGADLDDFLIELLDADDTVLASLDESDGSAVIPAAGTWELNSLEHLVLAGDPSIGKLLKICLSSTIPQAEFDDVSLDVKGKTCSSVDEEICKTIDIVHDDLDPNGYIEPHEPVWYITTIITQNPTAFQWEDVKVQDNLGGDLEIGGSNNPQNDLTTEDNLDCSDSKTKGKTKKVQLRCDVAGDGELDPNGAETATLGFSAHTDVNPGQGKPGGQGKLEYTSCGIHFANSGATVSGFDTDSQTSFEFSTAGIFVEVFTDDKAGDCDGDTIIDSEEESNGTNPFERDTDGDGSNDNLDCEPLDDTIFPGATEILNDAVDQNCNGNDDEDEDGDTYTVNGGDCNDGNAAINPGATEITGNAIDEDCDGVAQP